MRICNKQAVSWSTLTLCLFSRCKNIEDAASPPKMSFIVGASLEPRGLGGANPDRDDGGQPPKMEEARCMDDHILKIFNQGEEAVANVFVG
jgi:hypothetical protein